ncbi:MAG: hypothetical protein BM556_14000 [Bacteriovorax sp. MedPE-SWde]|nr:MAG: hypothetical protein BM556_14000 [Bacteriovorax sp. MedPE-SWde]
MSKAYKYFKAGEILFDEGHESEVLYFVESGKIEVYKERNCEEIVLNRIGKGEVLGTLALLGNHRRTASARAITNTKCMIIDASFLANSDEQPKWLQAVIKDILKRFQELEVKYLKLELEKRGIK